MFHARRVVSDVTVKSVRPFTYRQEPFFPQSFGRGFFVQQNWGNFLFLNPRLAVVAEAL